MFIVCFGDGLGNQMFQYAFYKSLKFRYPNNIVKMDVFHIYGKYIHNGFELNSIFGITVDECSKRAALLLSDYFPMYEKKYKLLNRLQGVRRYFWGVKESFLSQDDPTCYYDEVYHLSQLRSYIFKGNWVNEKYFSELREQLLADFKFPEITEMSNIDYAYDIENSNSVSVHIRKGDYVNSGMINLTLEYYKMAQKVIESRVDNPKYFIFTDDKHAIKDFIKIFEDSCVIVEGNIGNKSYRDMQLMSLCKHNIIANSTFSFWGAYLNTNIKKMVIAPDKAKADFRNPFAMSEWIILPYTGVSDT